MDRDSFGNQGAAQAQNLRDSGVPSNRILIANRQDAYAEDAISKGFEVEYDFPRAAQVADSKYNSFRGELPVSDSHCRSHISPYS